MNGNILKLIDNFLFSKKVALNINGEVGDLRRSSDYGLPQGSALSPILFRIYLMDLLEEVVDSEHISLYKFADDGTIKVTGESTEQCMSTVKNVIKLLEKWISKWRMVVNCQPDKTEYICFGTAERNDGDIPDTLLLGDKVIKRVKKTKVLGLTMDEKLTYKDHSNILYKKLLTRWTLVRKYSNRNWGLNQRVMVQLIKTLFVPSLSYAGHIWMKPNNMGDINGLWYKIIKASIGAVYNIKLSTGELILGLPPLHIQNEINRIKHFLKIVINSSPGDRYKEFIVSSLNNQQGPQLLVKHMRDVYKYLRWKLVSHPTHFTNQDTEIVQNCDINQIFLLTPKAVSYTKSSVTKYTELMWSASLKNEYILNGDIHIPNPSISNLPIPRETPRQKEVLLMSTFYSNNLMNNFLHKVNRNISPLCPACGLEEQTAFHILRKCPAVPNELTEEVYQSMLHTVGEPEVNLEDNTTLINCSRSQNFINSVLKVIEVVDLRTSIDIHNMD